jgi:hypothetical protein
MVFDMFDMFDMFDIVHKYVRIRTVLNGAGVMFYFILLYLLYFLNLTFMASFLL